MSFFEEKLIKDFKENIFTQFRAVITFGFAITALYSSLYLLIIKELFIFSKKEIIFLLLSFIGYNISIYNTENKIITKINLLKYLDFIFTMLGFTLMLVPIVIIIERLSTPIISFNYNLIKNILICLLLSLVIFLIKSFSKKII
jgi:hypothetical protein